MKSICTFLAASPYFLFNFVNIFILLVLLLLLDFSNLIRERIIIIIRVLSTSSNLRCSPGPLQGGISEVSRQRMSNRPVIFQSQF